MEKMTRPVAESPFAGAPSGAHVPTAESPLPSLAASSMSGSGVSPFATGQAGQSLVSHEAAHVIQQGQSGAPFTGMYG